ncbi:DNA polymerase III subunit alpha [Reichenbachiella versicolor]|uniref:DNA polymerase III subunit alpha n=1 Tax=Reichenbachiella versicolor TaxID=1821036 RepID=UPI000D6E2F96|nr:DNA polymerase III subunit alpha [Reichenbachiella versicolor]
MYLNTHSFFSFKYGVMSTDQLLTEAKNKNLSSFVLTDINSTAGCMRFIRDAHKFGIRPIVGVDFRNDTEQKFVLIAQNNTGFQNINVYLSKHLHQEEPFPDQAPQLDNTYTIYPYLSCQPDQLQHHEYVGIDPNDILKLPFSKWKNHIDKIVILRTVTIRKTHNHPNRKQPDFNVHRLLRAIHYNTLLTKLTSKDLCATHEYMLSKKELLDTFEDYPEIILNTKAIIDNSSIQFEFGDEYPHKNIQTFTGSEKEDYQKIRSLCLKKLNYRYPNPTIKIYRRLALELNMIKQKGFVSYFLVNWDIIEYAIRKKYFYIGRGSGANSIVAYILRITDVDPIGLDLYFERFINLYRRNPPDFDIDFSWRDRDDITKYIFETYGYDHVALLATYNTFKVKAAIREISKACGLPPHEITRLTETLKADDSQKAIHRLDKLSMSILNYAVKLEKIPSHLSIHASGIIISDKPIYHFTATNMPPKGFPITHFDMTEAEDAGLYKFDILSQRGLSKIKETLEIIRYNQPQAPRIDIHDTKRFFKDEKIKHLLRTGQAIGCFYVESPAMRMLLKKLKVDHYEGLVAASSIIRPGVAKSGMMRQYIIRFRKPEKRKEAHPTMKKIMPDTFGIMVYQEDVIKVAHYFAGLTLAESDKLRRGMSGKYRSRAEFKEVERRYFEECRKKGHSEKLIHEVWHQIMSFAGYAFAKGHSASYAIESYQCLFLKAYYPLEYMVSIINNGGGFYRPELYIHEAKMLGAIIEPPCINTSRQETTIDDKTIYLGFHIVQDLDHNSIIEILEKRDYYFEFKSLEEFVNRVNIGIEQLQILIRIGAFRTIDSNKKKLLWESFMLLNKSKYTPPSLFKTRVKKFNIPNLYIDPREKGFDEIEILGFPLENPFNLTLPYGKPYSLSAELSQFKNKKITMLGYLIATKNTGTSKGQRMFFGTFIDEAGHFIDTVHFPPIASKYPIRGQGIYEIKGTVTDEFDFLSVEVSSLIKVHYINMEDIPFSSSSSKGIKEPSSE